MKKEKDHHHFSWCLDDIAFDCCIVDINICMYIIHFYSNVFEEDKEESHGLKKCLS